MSLWVCDGCTCRYAVGAPACPHCGETGHRNSYEVDAELAAQEQPAAEPTEPVEPSKAKGSGKATPA